ncbi:(5-formylfuran-3-yl)methyl phosphate synthase [Bosea sp. 117]|uniref:(5-formylfuran-3-yl)methyl phosphate synthase n=1 Tax=Bosea sp. 117 TaxID=1125973 RepID=UPI0004943679|nr:(5-formylfuran-3-yl)methyl phosphate synthase [Bosea sp. 117]
MSTPSPRLLASVADLAEMEIARAGGADIVDLKQPAFGALGAWSTEALTAAVMLWNAWPSTGPSPRPLLSATAGDQPMVPAILAQAAGMVAASGVPIVKVGLFRSAHVADCIEALAPLTARTQLVGVLFADQEPDFGLVAALGQAGFAGVMLDTADKRAGGLTAHMDALTLSQFVVEARRHGLMTGLAGSLALDDIEPLSCIGADYLGFRGVLCADGRTGSLDRGRLAAVRERMPAFSTDG